MRYEAWNINLLIFALNGSAAALEDDENEQQVARLSLGQLRLFVQILVHRAAKRVTVPASLLP